MTIPPSSISAHVRELRIERHWTQKSLAAELGLSQSRLSEIETGQGAFTAEQFLRVLQLFNVTVDRFAARRTEIASQLQNAIARLGASHLFESDTVLPSERLQEVLPVIRETLVAPESSRQVTGLAPVIVNHINDINFSRLESELAALGRERRLYWLIDSVQEAVEHEDGKDLPREWRIRYRRTAALCGLSLRHWSAQSARIDVIPDVLDPVIASAESLAEVQAEASEAARRWRIVTRIKAEDFVDALREARDTA
ncbi:MAG: helix-turn-helix transcriptional regulator [Elusimicrobia bacterium]|nr:helix-turn-helix transcriptional regulator [Elusimicrobiota bacterium]